MHLDRVRQLEDSVEATSDMERRADNVLYSAKLFLKLPLGKRKTILQILCIGLGSDESILYLSQRHNRKKHARSLN